MNARASFLMAGLCLLLAGYGRPGLATPHQIPVGPGLSTQIWIDTDTSCGLGPFKDVDDCIALMLMAEGAGNNIAAVSSTFGNAGRKSVDAVLDRLWPMWAHDYAAPPPRFSGARRAGDCRNNEAAAALAARLDHGSLTILALGPLTNIACAVHGSRERASNIQRIVAVIGAAPGQVFHPSEGNGEGIFGHGPIARDLNAELDPDTVAALLSSGVHLQLAPYAVARRLLIGPAGIEGMASNGKMRAFIGDTASEWRRTWSQYIGVHGIYPFDAFAALRVLDPDAMDCSEVRARVARDRNVFLGLAGPRRLIVAAHPDAHTVAWCASVTPQTQLRLSARVVGT
jgi:inosine-uridine nucleoside N-ribohydrolase